MEFMSSIKKQRVVGIRNHIAHGYFEIDGEVVYNVIKQDLNPLLEAVEYLLDNLRQQQE